MKKLVVTTSVQLTEQEKNRLKPKLFDVFGEANVDFYVDEALLGGIIVFDGDSVYDGSVHGRLNRVAAALKK